ncbi:MAG TPA: TIGR00730 family Rossman fold protein [Ktedonobacterales bacterium]|nr:TIGR00730 family Rossman fold protein [Ktedonobacterales bacterium]
MRRICVFAGSSPGGRPVYTEVAQALGCELAQRGLGLVYGGASRGLMGVVADAALAAGGEVIGVMPHGLFAHEVAHQGLTELFEVGSMHERKALMAQLSDGFIALPGGYGTCDELFEAVTWAQVGIHQKPVGLLEVHDYFATLLAFVAHASNEGFIPPAQTDLLLRETDPAALLDAFARYQSPADVTPPPTPPVLP